MVNDNKDIIDGDYIVRIKENQNEFISTFKNLLQETEWEDNIETGINALISEEDAHAVMWPSVFAGQRCMDLRDENGEEFITHLREKVREREGNINLSDDEADNKFFDLFPCLTQSKQDVSHAEEENLKATSSDDEQKPVQKESTQPEKTAWDKLSTVEKVLIGIIPGIGLLVLLCLYISHRISGDNDKDQSKKDNLEENNEKSEFQSKESSPAVTPAAEEQVQS